MESEEQSLHKDFLREICHLADSLAQFLVLFLVVSN